MLKNYSPKIIISIIILVILIMGITLRIKHLNGVQLRTRDEEVYTIQGKAIVNFGGNGIKLLVRYYNSHSEEWIYPPPIRVGYLWILSSVMKLTNSTDVKIGSYISCVFSIISLLILIILGLRFFNQGITLFALLFLSISPLDLAIARRTWQDAMFGCFGLSLVYLCCEITRNSRKIILYLFLILIGSYSLLIKESGIVIYGLCMLWILWVLFIKEKSYRKGIILIISAIVGAVVSMSILSYSAGGIQAVIETLRHVKEAMSTNKYAILYQTERWYGFLSGFWMMSPVNAVLSLVGIMTIFVLDKTGQRIIILEEAKKRQAEILGIALFSVLFLAITIFTPYCQNLRYVSVLYGPWYLMSGLGFWSSISVIKKILKGPYFTIAIVFISAGIIFVALADYSNFLKIFVNRGIMDTSVQLIREAFFENK